MSNSVDFVHNFKTSLKTSLKLSNALSTDILLPQVFPCDIKLFPNFIFPVAGGKITASYPHSYDMEHLDAYCILYTEEGSGYLRYENRTFYLDPNSLVFFDCRKFHHIEIQHSPWEFKLLYLKGAPVAHYYELFTTANDIIFFTGKSNYLSELIEQILQTDPKNEYYTLIQNKKLTEFLTSLSIEKKHGYLPQSEVRSHVTEMKYMFDTHYEFHYTLEWLENHFGISRYRLCREFKEAEGKSPIAYLNSIRMKSAMHLLISSQMRINEIARAVGIDNMNHFIKLFKTYTGTTPTNYRK